MGCAPAGGTSGVGGAPPDRARFDALLGKHWETKRATRRSSTKPATRRSSRKAVTRRRKPPIPGSCGPVRRTCTFSLSPCFTASQTEVAYSSRRDCNNHPHSKSLRSGEIKTQKTSGGAPGALRTSGTRETTATRIRSRGSGSSPSQRAKSPGARMTGVLSLMSATGPFESMVNWRTCATRRTRGPFSSPRSRPSSRWRTAAWPSPLMAFHSKKPSTYTAPRAIGVPEAGQISNRLALSVDWLAAAGRSWHQFGMRPQCRESSDTSPVRWLRRMISRSWLGAAFQRGG